MKKIIHFGAFFTHFWIWGDGEGERISDGNFPHMVIPWAIIISFLLLSLSHRKSICLGAPAKARINQHKESGNWLSDK